MKVVFKESRVVQGKLYRRSSEPQDIPEKALENWFVRNCIHNGDILVPAGTKMEPIKGLSKPPKKVREVSKQ